MTENHECNSPEEGYVVDGPKGVECRAHGRALTLVPEVANSRCEAHPAYEANYCPLCGTARVIGA